MKKRLKMKRYEGGGDVDDDVEPEVIRRSYASGVRVKYEDEPAVKSKSAAKKEDDSYDRKEMRETSRASSPAAKSSDAGAALDYGNIKRGAIRRERSDEEKARNAENTQRLGAALATALSAGRVGRGAYGAQKTANRIRDISQTAKAQEMTATEAARAARIRARQDMFGSGKAAREFAEAGGMKRGGSVGSASRRADGIAQRGKTRGTLI